MKLIITLYGCWVFTGIFVCVRDSNLVLIHWFLSIMTRTYCLYAFIRWFENMFKVLLSVHSLLRHIWSIVRRAQSCSINFYSLCSDRCNGDFRVIPIWVSLQLLTSKPTFSHQLHGLEYGMYIGTSYVSSGLYIRRFPCFQLFPGVLRKSLWFTITSVPRCVQWFLSSKSCSAKEVTHCVRIQYDFFSHSSTRQLLIQRVVQLWNV